MAERWAIIAGNWSATATWNGGTLPAAGDDVYANNFTVTIDQNVSVKSLNTKAGTTAIAGGQFNVPAGAVRTVNADVFGGTTLCLNGLQSNLTFTGNSTGGSAANAYGVQLSGPGSTQTGNSLGGSFANANGSQVLSGAVHNGNSVGGSTNGAFGTNLSGGAFQNGTATGGSALGATGTNCANGSVFTGNAFGSLTGAALGCSLTTGSVMVGDSTGGAIVSAGGSNGANGSIIYGRGIGGSSAGAYGIKVDSSAVAVVTGVTDNVAKGAVINDRGVYILHNGVQLAQIGFIGSPPYYDGTKYPFIREASSGVVPKNFNGGFED